MSIRLRGWLMLLGGSALFGLFAFWVSHPDQYPFSYHPTGPGGAILIGLPGAVALVGLIEFATGKAFRELEAMWASLSWWKKGLLGSLIIVFGGAVVFTVVGLLVA